MEAVFSSRSGDGTGWWRALRSRTVTQARSRLVFLLSGGDQRSSMAMRADLSTIQQTLTPEAAVALARADGAGAPAAHTHNREFRLPGILSPAALPSVASTGLFSPMSFDPSSHSWRKT
jgi:hypothetical protein